MGLLDYYRQFDDVDPELINRGLRARRERERALALQAQPRIDLSTTEWPTFPNSEIVNASIAAARGRVNVYPDRHAAAVRRLLAERHAVEPEQVVLGNGAGDLLQAATLTLVSKGDEVITPWPSYPLFPLLAQRAGGKPVAVDLTGGAVDVAALRAAVTARTRVLVLANPNDPTGTYLDAETLAGLLGELPKRVHVLLDEAYVQFQDVEPEDACLRLVDAFPQLLVFRTFSKIYGLSGLRAGYAVAPPHAATTLQSIAPPLGVSALTQAGVLQALRIGDAEIRRRRGLVVDQRRRILDALHDLPVDAPPSEANFVWLRAAGLSGGELTARLERSGVIVAPGATLGDEEHVRASIRGAEATTRLISALQSASKTG
jgi:histidinol-phosphate aminotransferase